MSTETLSTSISTGIVLTAAGSFTSPFTVTSSGTISSTGSDIVSSVSNASLLNFGLLDGNLNFTNTGIVANIGTIKGNVGSTTVTNAGAVGAVLLDGTNSYVYNSGLVAGSTTSNYGVSAGAGAKVVNAGSILGADMGRRTS